MDRLISSDDVLAKELQDPEFRERWERTATARKIAVEVSHYRAAHSLSQRELADQLEMTQARVASIEAGEHTPDPKILARLAVVVRTEPWLTRIARPAGVRYLRRPRLSRIARR